MHIFVILLNWNGYKDTLECIHSLKQSTYTNYTLAIVDNGSSDDSCKHIRAAYPDITLIENKKNLGFAEGNNVGINYAIQHDADAIFLLNNDTICDSHLLETLTQASVKHPSTILGAKILRYQMKDHLDHLGGKWNPKKYQFDLIGLMALDHPSFYTSSDLDYVCGCALFAKTEVFKTVGNLDPRFFLYWEESDFCFRAKKHGISIILCDQATLWHKGSASMVGGKPHTSYYWWRNRLLFIRKQFPLTKRIYFYCMIFSRELFKLLRHYCLIFTQMIVQKMLKNQAKYETKRQKFLHIKASLIGCFHYFTGRFFEGPSWISKKSSSLNPKT